MKLGEIVDVEKIEEIIISFRGTKGSMLEPKDRQLARILSNLEMPLTIDLTKTNKAIRDYFNDNSATWFDLAKHLKSKSGEIIVKGE